MAATRREFLQSAVAVSLGFRGLRTLLACGGPPRTHDGVWTAPGFGPLRPDPHGLLDLPDGFAYHVLSRMGERMDDGFLVPGDPDGMATYPGPDGKTILIRNHELAADELDKSPFGSKNELLDRLPNGSAYDLGRRTQPCLGGTTTLLYDTRLRRLERQYLSLAGTQNNCAGGPTPWNSWVSCEETVQRADDRFERDHGYPFEVPATVDGRLAQPVPLRTMGRFNHEALCVDPRSGVVYQTEDREDGLIYRFIPDRPGELAAGGRLQTLAVRDAPSLDARNWLDERGAPLGPRVEPAARLPVRWLDIRDIDAPADDLRARGFADGATRFARAEGMWFGRNAVYFACTNGGRTRSGQIWRYTPGPHEATPRESERPGTLELFIEPNDPGLVDNADNLTIAPWGDLVVCEDGEGDQFLVGVTPQGGIYKLARNAGAPSEFAGSVFSPDGSTLFVNLQTVGLTLAITGPWDRARRGEG